MQFPRSPLPLAPPGTQPRNPDAPIRGFALLVTIVLVAFLVLILVGLASFTRVETQVAGNSQQLAQARQNALMALNVALGELQEHLGPDRRVSAASGLGTATNTSYNTSPASAWQNDWTNGTGSKPTQWTGVWREASPAPANTTRDPAFVAWLVSGNEINGRAVTPQTPIADPSTDPNVVWLVGDKSVQVPATVSAANPDPRVKLPKQPITSASLPGFTGPQTIGSYAYWVGDEGTKAKANLVDPYAGSVAGTANNLKQLSSAQRTGPEITQGLSTFPAPTAPAGITAAANATKVLTTLQLPMLAPAVAASTWKARFHDLTTSSFGLLADTAQGGLKTDLSYLLAPAANVAAFQTRLTSSLTAAELGSAVTGNNGTSFYPLLPSLPVLSGADSRGNMATWEQLWSFNNLTTKVAGSGLTASIPAQPHTALQTGVHPVLVQARVGFGIRVNSRTGTDPTNYQYSLNLDTRLAFVLANPYAVSITGGEYYFTLDAGAGNTNAADVGKLNAVVITTSGPVTTVGPWMSLEEIFRKVKFRIPAGITFGPGEARIFTLAGAPGTAIPHTLSTDSTYDLINTWDGAALTGVGPYTTLSIPAGTTAAGKLTANLGVSNGAGRSNTSLGNDSYLSYWVTDPVSAEKKMALRIAGFPFMNAGSPSVLVNGSATAIVKGLSGISLSAVPTGEVFVGDALVYRHGAARERIDTNADSRDHPFKGASNGGYVTVNGAPFVRGNMIGENDPRFMYLQFNTPGAPFANYGIPSKNQSQAASFRNHLNDLVFSDNERVRWGVGSNDLTRPDTNTALNNQPAQLVLFDIPRPDAPLVSLGQLQHFSMVGHLDANFSALVSRNPFTTTQPSITGPDNSRSMRGQSIVTNYGFANSYAPTYIPRQATTDSRMDASSVNAYDYAYLFNEAFFDRFYFSSFPQSGAFDFTTATLANSRYLPFRTGLAADAYRTDARSASANLLSSGAFNVNSISVQAWAAVLNSLNGANYESAETAETNLTAPFARTTHQAYRSTGNGNPLVDKSAWGGFRTLTSTEILDDRGTLDATDDTGLAVEIVRQVKERGPFLSLADFVNRRLISSANDTSGLKIGVKGALQSAIDPAIPGAPAKVFSVNSTSNISVSDYAGRPPSRLTGTNAGTQDSDMLYPSWIAGHPGWMIQGDLLQPLAPYLTARSDTFKIRAYGDVLNPATGSTTPTARAWCEAIVQRIPDYVDPAQPASTPIASLNALNSSFGRRFQIVSFRWLSPDDI